ncbi:MAG: sigma 54-interacting transcriptional regulator [Megasphaera sp.]|jgi:PAS domain S-box-containing protein|nr:sigma 54-interacting transcriptional regulator [Megasphaera sp.]MCI1824243.1 sigma 54-interacting transcriptional regulator [Megasphaera sp.]
MKNTLLHFTTRDYENVINALYCSILIVNRDGHPIYYNLAAQKLAKESNVNYQELLAKLSEQIDIGNGQGRFSIDNRTNWIICNIYPWINRKKRNGSILVLHESGHAVCASQEVDILTNTLKEIDAIIESVADGVIVADGAGIIIRINKAVERTFNVHRNTLIGQSSTLIVQKGVFKEGIVEKVLQQQDKVIVASEYAGKKLIYTGIPSFNEKKLTCVIVTIQDVSAMNMLRHKLEKQELAMADYVREIANMKSKDTVHDTIVVHSKKMTRIMEIINVVSSVDSTVLITGESGTGKERVVDAIYQHSNRNMKPLIKINCGAIPDTLFESELFGYEHGSFTGARKNGKIGFFELANTGTLLLDEIGELSLTSQVKLLRVIQEKEVLRIGGSKPVPIDVRIIAATNRNLWNMVKEGTFRQDLYYRLNVINIDVPPLRERRDDIIPLARYFVEMYNEKYKKNKTLSLAICHALGERNWPGNIRELENVIETMVVLVPGNLLLPEHLPQKTTEDDKPGIVVHGIQPMKEAVHDVERQLLMQAAKKYKTTREIAYALGIDQATVSRKMNKLCR